MTESARHPIRRTAAWVAVLSVAALAGFGLGALTYHPPEPEMDVPQASEVGVDPSLSPSPVVAIPDVVGMHRNAAERSLDSLGVLYLIDPIGGRDDDLVLRQHPAAGEPVRPSTNVLLSVRCHPKPCPPPPEGQNLYDPCACRWR
jgi:hypothetical protein